MKKGTIIVIVAAVVIIGLYYFYTNGNLGDFSFQRPSEQALQIEEQSDISLADALAQFPEGFPIEENAQDLETFTDRSSDDGSIDYVISYTSKEAFSQNENIFKSYLASSGFEIVDDDLENGVHFYSGTKDNQELAATIQQFGEQVAVSAVFTYQ